MSSLKKTAELLVDIGIFAEVQPVLDGRKIAFYIGFVEDSHGGRDFRKHQHVDPYEDSLNGRRQADALEDWLSSSSNLTALSIWLRSNKAPRPLNLTSYEWRLNRIRSSLTELCRND